MTSECYEAKKDYARYRVCGDGAEPSIGRFPGAARASQDGETRAGMSVSPGPGVELCWNLRGETNKPASKGNAPNSKGPLRGKAASLERRRVWYVVDVPVITEGVQGNR